MKKRYADMDKAMEYTGLRGLDCITKGENGAGEKLYRRIERALEKAQVDAVEVTRCEKCMFCVQLRGMKYLKCLCPEVPAHRVQEDGYCNHGKPKGRN